jgi:hypothetical protein
MGNGIGTAAANRVAAHLVPLHSDFDGLNPGSK